MDSLIQIQFNIYEQQIKSTTFFGHQKYIFVAHQKGLYRQNGTLKTGVIKKNRKQSIKIAFKRNHVPIQI